MHWYYYPLLIFQSFRGNKLEALLSELYLYIRDFRKNVDIAIWMHHLDAKETYEEKAWQQLHKNDASCIEQILEATPHKTAAVRPPNTHHENYQK